MYSQGYHVASAHYAGAHARCALWTDDATISGLIFDVVNNYQFQMNWGNGHLIYYAGGVPVFSIDPNGNVLAKGTFTGGASPSAFEALGAVPLSAFDASVPMMEPQANWEGFTRRTAITRRGLRSWSTRFSRRRSTRRT